MARTSHALVAGRQEAHEQKQQQGFTADQQDGVAELFGWYEAGR
jgi:hypothetical protein